MTKAETKTQISISAIIFAALIGIGFAVTLGSLGGAISMSMNPNSATPNNGVLSLIGIVVVICITFAFFIAGYIASKISHQRFRFDSIIHSLGTWAVMAILLVIGVSVAGLAENVRESLSGLKAPVILTDIEVWKAKATTTIHTGDKDKKDRAEQKEEEEEADRMLILSWWIAFASLVLGAGASVSGGLLGRRPLPLIETLE